MFEVLFVFIFMLFCHIVNDYYLQGCLTNLKNKSWWQENAPDEMYKYDYIVGLFMHSASWSFMIMIPLILFCSLTFQFAVIAWAINTVVHAVVDDLKCNRLKINLFTNQMIHISQILATLFFALL